MKNIYILLPTKHENNDVKKLIEKTVRCTCIDDDFMNSFNSDNFDDDVFINLKLKIFKRLFLHINSYIIIISDYPTACRLFNCHIYTFIPSKKYLEEILCNLPDYSDIVNRCNDITYPYPKLKYSEYDSLEELLQNIEATLIENHRRWLYT